MVLFVKMYLLSFLTLGCSLTSMAQYPDIETVEVRADHPPIITGQFINRPVGWQAPVLLAETQSLTSLDLDIDTVRVAPDGKFRIHLPSPLPLQQVELYVGDDYFFLLLTNDSLHLTLDATKMAQRQAVIETFSGPAATLNRAMERYQTMDRSAYRGRLYWSLTPADLDHPDLVRTELRMQAVGATVDSLYRDYLQRHPDTPDSLTLRHWMWHEYVYAPLVTVVALWTGRNTYQAATPEERAVLIAVSQQIPVVWNGNAAAFYASVGSLKYQELPPAAIRAAGPLGEELVLLLHAPRDPQAFSRFVEQISPQLQTDWLKELLLKRNAQVAAKRRLARDRLQRAVVSTALDYLDGRTLERDTFLFFVADTVAPATLIASLLGNHRAIILDFWAPWCGPCIYDWQTGLPIKLALKAVDIPVVYLCTATQTTQEQWRRAAIAHDQRGIHVYLNSTEEAALRRLVDAVDTGYPEYVLIDQRRRSWKDPLNQLISQWSVAELLDLINR